MMKYPKLKSKLTKRFIAVISIPLIVMATVVIALYYWSLERQILHYNLHYTEFISKLTVSALEEAEHRLEGLSLNLNDNAMSSAVYQKTIAHMVNTNKSLLEVRVLDHNFHIKSIIPNRPEMLGFDMSGVKYVRQAQDTGNTTWSKAYLSVVSGTPVASLVVPYSRGTVVATFDFNVIYQISESYHDDLGSLQIAVIDHGGTIIAHTIKQKVEQREWEGQSHILRRAITENRYEVTSISIGNQILTGKIVSKTGWLIVLYQDKKIFTSVVRQMSMLLVIASIFFIIIGVYVALKTSQGVFSFFDRHISDIKLLASGKYDKKKATEQYVELRNIDSLFLKTSQQISSREHEVKQLNKQLGEKLVLAENALRKQAEAEDNLVVSHNTLRAVLDGINMAIFVADFDTHEILFLNKYLKEQLGSDVTGKACWQALRNEDKECGTCPNSHLLDSTGQPTEGHVRQGENPITKKWSIYNDKAIPWLDGRYVKLQIATDITEVKQMEEELRQAHKMEAIGTLAGGVAHDFNNILAAIIGYSELATDDIPGDHPAADSLKSILTASNRAKNVVQKLLAFSRKTAPEKAVIKLSALLDESLNILKATLPTSIDIRVETSENEGLVLADPTELQQILINLISNAAQSIEQNIGSIEISLNEIDLLDEPWGVDNKIFVGKHVELTIIDSGEGMSQQTISKIFDPYFTTKEVGKGTGLGLAIVHGILKSHNGAISVSSQSGRGTTVKIILPSCSEKMPPVEIFPEENKLHVQGERILLVDDDESILKMTTSMLERLGYRVYPQLNSEDAYNAFAADPYSFDLLFTDMTMPQMSGLTLSEKVFEIRNDIPIVICTGNRDRLEAKVDSLKISACIDKPFAKTEMEKVLRDLLDSDRK